MSHFYGTIEGQAKTAATRRGSPRSGINAHIRGWNSGVYISAFVDNDGRDCFRVSVTGGSNGARKTCEILTVSETCEKINLKLIDPEKCNVT